MIATLHLFHWVDPTVHNLVGADALHATSEAAWRDIQQLDMDLLVKGLLKGIPDKVLVEEGDLSQVLSRVVGERAIDLIVIGTHGRTGLRKLIMGSVAEKIFRQASCPVLTVGPDVSRSQLKEAGPGTILFPTDFSPQVSGAEPYAFSLARKHSVRLTLLHALEDAPGSILAERSRLEWTRNQLQELVVREEKVTDSTDLLVKIGPPDDVILRVADERKADLIVLGVRAPYHFTDRFMWPNAYRIVCESRCPVLTVRTLR